MADTQSSALMRAAERRRRARGGSRPVAVAQPADPPGSVARGLAQQLGQGASFGFSDELAAGTTALASQFTRGGREQGFGNIFSETLDAERASMEQNRQRLGTGVALGAQVAGGVLTGGALARALMKHGVQAGRALFSAAAIEGGAAGAGVSEGDLFDRAKGAATGAAIGAATHGTINKLGTLAGARLPGDASQIPLAAGKDIGTRARQLNMRLTGGQATGNRTAQIAESASRRSALTTGVFDSATKHNRIEANRAVLRRFGRKGDRVDGDVLEDIRKEIGQEFDDIGASMAPTLQPTQDVSDALQRAAGMIDDVEKPARLINRIADVEELFTNPAGASPNTFMIKLSKIRDSAARAARKGEIDDAEALGELEDALIGAAMENNPQLAARLDAARHAWRDLKIIDTPQVVDAATGQIHPVNLAGMLNRSKFTRRIFGQTAETENPIMELGRMVRQLNDTIGDPGTAWGFNRGSFTPEGLSLGLGEVLMSPAKLAIAIGQTHGSRATTAATQGANTLAPRIAALNLAPREPSGGRNNRNR